MAPVEDDDARHRREEAERRAKRKAAKSSKKSSSEKDRKRREHTQRVLKQQNKHKKPRLDEPITAADESKFAALFAQRSQGFKMDFSFRNAPPRPPVGPCFVGLGLDGQLQECSQYHPTVELNYTWKLHSEPNLGVPLAPSAMDNKCYQETPSKKELHPDDDALLNWTGSMGDTAAEQLKLKRDQARAAARLALKGKAPAVLPSPATATTPSNQQPKKKKEFSRVLDESMQSWMKRTTYLSNDYSRKVHDFTSLAKTKQKTAESLQAQQAEMDAMRSAEEIDKTFQQEEITAHPTKKHLKPVSQLAVLPNVEHWGQTYTQVVLDNPPKGVEDPKLLKESLDHAFVAHVEKKERLSCQLLVPSSDGDSKKYSPMQQYDLDVVPLKDEDAPHVNYCLIVDDATATYLPISSRVLLSTGRPVKKKDTTTIERRPPSQQDRRACLERLAEVDVDVANQVEKEQEAAASYNPAEQDSSSSSSGDEQDEQEKAFEKSTTIVAEG